MAEIVELLAGSPAIFALVAAIVGLVVGSFLNVVIHRLPVMMERALKAECAALAGGPPAEQPGYNLIYPRSACPGCGAPISVAQNIPVLSWLLLKGHCAACRRPISLRYPMVELITALTSAIVAWRFGFGAHALAVIVATWLLIALTGIDLDHQLLPDSLTLLLLWLGLLASVALPHDFRGFPVSPSAAILGAVCGYGSLWCVYHGFKLLTGKEGMGHGDFKLFAALGAWLGWQLLVPLILFAAGAGAVVGIALIALRKHGREAPMPFGPYLAVAGWLLLVASSRLVAPWWPLAH